MTEFRGRLKTQASRCFMPKQPLEPERAFDPETIDLMRETLDDAWGCLSPQEQSCTLKSDLAARILHAVANGERDKGRLRAHALLRLAPRPSDAKTSA